MILTCDILQQNQIETSPQKKFNGKVPPNTFTSFPYSNWHFYLKHVSNNVNITGQLHRSAPSCAALQYQWGYVKHKGVTNTTVSSACHFYTLLCTLFLISFLTFLSRNDQITFCKIFFSILSLPSQHWVHLSIQSKVHPMKVECSWIWDALKPILVSDIIPLLTDSWIGYQGPWANLGSDRILLKNNNPVHLYLCIYLLDFV